MPCHFRVETGSRIVSHTLSGAVSRAEILLHQRAVLEAPGDCRGYGHLVDIRKLERGGPSYADLDSLARHTPVTELGPIAFVVDSPYQHGLARQFAGLAELAHDLSPDRSAIQIFHTPEAARAWLAGDRGVRGTPHRHVPIPLLS